MKRLLVILVNLIIVSAIWADVTEIITMKNGNVYKGNLWLQLSNGEIGFKADTSVVYLPATKISRIDKYADSKGGSESLADIYLVSVPDTAALSVDVVAGEAMDSVSAMSDSTACAVTPSNKTNSQPNGSVDVIRGVKLLEEGSIVKYLDTNHHELNLRVKDIRLISRPSRNESLINGLMDEIVTKSGQIYKGYIVTTEPGVSIRINSDGRIYSVLLSDIGVQRKIAIDKDQSVYTQSPVIDNIYMSGDGEVILDVVLIEQNYAKGTFDVIDRNNVVTRRPLPAITKIRKEINRDYHPRKEFSFEADSIYINRICVPERPYDRKGSRIKAKIDNGSFIPSVSPVKGCITIETTDNSAIRRAVLMSLGHTVPTEINLDLSDLVVKNVPVHSQEISQSKNVISRAYSVVPGYYILINTENRTFVLFRVQ